MHPAELVAFAGFGAVILIVAWLPLWLERLPLTLPMLAVGAGSKIVSLGFAGSRSPKPMH